MERMPRPASSLCRRYKREALPAPLATRCRVASGAHHVWGDERKSLRCRRRLDIFEVPFRFACLGFGVLVGLCSVGWRHGTIGDF
jgi:hypothetical protein